MIKDGLAGFAPGFVKLAETAEGLERQGVPLTARGLQPGVSRRQLFLGFAVSFEPEQTSAQMTAAALDHPMLRLKRLLKDRDGLPLQLFSFGGLTFEVKHIREIVQTRAYLRVVFSPLFATYRQRLPVKGFAAGVVSPGRQQGPQVVHRGRQSHMVFAKQLAPQEDRLPVTLLGFCVLALVLQ